jgi:hypothetical protein
MCLFPLERLEYNGQSEKVYAIVSVCMFVRHKNTSSMLNSREMKFTHVILDAISRSTVLF